MKTWHIHIEGQVQGVGFRPFTFSLANELSLNGTVKNTVDGVHIVFNADKSRASLFRDRLIAQAPPLSQITNISLTETSSKLFEDFRIVRSEISGDAVMVITPDFSICEHCRRELKDRSDRRYKYPFITCTNCGPRYSILKQLPYDRTYTTMDSFTMCETCQDEYENPLDRRFAAQTNSCPSCKIELQLYGGDQELKLDTQNDILNKVVDLWKDGRIVAIKGIGGFMLTCDASNSLAIKELRKRKHRKDKPFAIMAGELSILLETGEISKHARDLLRGPIAPIVLLNSSGIESGVIAIDDVAPKLNRVGIMLPNTPLHELLMRRFKKPIVATSGNVTSAPIVFRDGDALERLSHLADYILTNDRLISSALDDSVVQYSLFTEQKIVLRRSRGLAPSYMSKLEGVVNDSILALGAMLKSTFTIANHKNIYISQYLGSLQDFDCYENYQYTIQYLSELLSVRPEVVLIDQHPGFPNYSLGISMAKQMNIPTVKVQHHKAHFGAILGEHGLIHTRESILGIIWDGAGLGEDGHIWGGEFFSYQEYSIERCNHFEYFEVIAGDKMAKEPRISAFAIAREVDGSEPLLREKFSDSEWRTYTKVIQNKQTLKTSSVGRIFDAIASLLVLNDVQSYEGQAAIQLEQLATQYYLANGLNFSSSYFAAGMSCPIPTKSLMQQVVQDLNLGRSKEFIAAKFHYSLVKLIETVAINVNIKKLAFSGGVFQNALLVDLIQYHLDRKFELYFHQELSPNDENISFGQVICYQIQQQNSLNESIN